MKRKKLYKKLLKDAKKAHSAFSKEMKKIEEEMDRIDILPSKKQRLCRVVQWMKNDIDNIKKVIGYCTARVFENKKVGSKEKVLSMSDEDAGYIQKGQRDPVIGYKPQLGRSKNGFIATLKVPRGNAADSGQFESIVNDVIDRTGVIPYSVSVDDGYSSKAVRLILKEKGIKIVSISGSKGKKITSKDEYESNEYTEARNARSAVESLMFSIKYGYDFGQVMRRGLENVRAELLEKTLVYNFLRIIHIQK